jgi:DNA-binding response OmpR family regulator
MTSSSAAGHSAPAGGARADGPPARVLVYSDDRRLRDRVSTSLGVRPDLDIPPLRLEECATEPAVLALLDAGGIDLCIFDGETVPVGGIGLCRQIKNEIFEAPPVLVLIGRPDDAWLATWAMADETVAYPVNPMELSNKVVALLKARLTTTDVATTT